MDSVFLSSNGCKINILILRRMRESCSPHSTFVQGKILTALRLYIS